MSQLTGERIKHALWFKSAVELMWLSSHITSHKRDRKFRAVCVHFQFAFTHFFLSLYALVSAAQPPSFASGLPEP